MALDVGVLEQLRSWVGSIPDDAALEAIYLRNTSSVTATALVVLKSRRASLLAAGGPDAFNAQGDYSESGRYAGLATLNALIAQLEAIEGGVVGGVLTTVPLSRPDRARR